MSIEFNSRFAAQINAMLDLKSALGLAARSIEYPMQSFDRFCQREFPDASILTREIAEAWCAEGNPGGKSGYKMHAVRSFGKYLVSVGIDAFVFPSEWIAHKKAALPHMFTDAELKEFFDASDKIPPNRNSPFWEYTIPVMFRLMYACGLRPQEARRLRRSEFDLHAHVLYVSETKKNKDRRLALGADIAELCRRYDAVIDSVTPDREYFFQSPRGSVCRPGWVTAQFHRCRELAGGIAPRSTPYDLRHNFATRTLMRWVEEGKDLGAWLPYLSAYMGHETFTGTAYYIHLLPERLSACDFTKANGVIPEAPR